MRAAWVVDVQGHRRPLALTGTTADIGHLATGLYLLEAETATGQVLPQRLVRE